MSQESFYPTDACHGTDTRQTSAAGINTARIERFKRSEDGRANGSITTSEVHSQYAEQLVHGAT